jgi:hypothetical protein
MEERKGKWEQRAKALELRKVFLKSFSLVSVVFERILVSIGRF